ncbi:MAG: hypothetical protein M3O82_01290, partial [Verrucomicrobiota bacterium]|nr:hypothetical protein [Verrucomicrobiota bacterium]
MSRRPSTSATLVRDNESSPPYARQVEAGLLPEERILNFGKKWEYAPAPETAPVKIDARYELFIGGKFVAPGKG